VHSLVAGDPQRDRPRWASPSLAVAGFTTLWRAGHLHKRNEADSGSLALRLTRSLAGASTAGSLPTPPGPLPAERAIRKATSFQVTRSVRLILTLRRHKEERCPELRGSVALCETALGEMPAEARPRPDRGRESVLVRTTLHARPFLHGPVSPRLVHKCFPTKELVLSRPGLPNQGLWVRIPPLACPAGRAESPFCLFGKAENSC
jgi:hypothetical protein